MSESDDFFGGSGRSAKFITQGDTVTGTIASAPTSRQQVDFKTKEPKVFKNGNPAMCLVVALQTGQKEDDEDDGIRNLYINKPSNLYDAVAAALHKAGAKGLEVGGTLTAVWTGLGEPYQKGANPPRVFAAVYENAPTPAEQHFSPEPAAAPVASQPALDLSGLDPATRAAIEALKAQQQ